MVRELEAVFEGGVLRPLEPLSLVENQHVRVTITDGPPVREVPYNDRRAEQEWIAAHGGDYPGEWVALEGEALLSHGADAFVVRDEARGKGVQHPLMVHLPTEPQGFSAGFDGQA